MRDKNRGGDRQIDREINTKTDRHRETQRGRQMDA